MVLVLCIIKEKGCQPIKNKLFIGLKKAAEKGNTDAQFNLALMYYNGDGILTDKKQAVYWYTKAAEQENAKAQFNLGIMYYLGEGTLTDKKQAAYWIKHAYENGFDKAKELWDACELWKY